MFKLADIRAALPYAPSVAMDWRGTVPCADVSCRPARGALISAPGDRRAPRQKLTPEERQ